MQPGRRLRWKDDSGSEPTLKFPQRGIGPIRSISVRIGVALAALLFTTVLVYAERGCYEDEGVLGAITWIDSFYYATVSLSTTGYGDITPVCESARLVNALVVTPLRFLFLIVLVGTTVEVLTRRTREQFRANRWRSVVNDHTVIIGYGVKGRSAAHALVDAGTPRTQIVVVSLDRMSVDAAARDGFVAVFGDARRDETLHDALIDRAARVVIAANEDDTSILVTLTARRLAPKATIVAAARESQNIEILRQSGANTVIPTAESAGRMMGLSLLSPTAGEILEDLLDSSGGLEVTERDITRDELGLAPHDLDTQGQVVLAVIRGGVAHRFDTDEIATLAAGDRLVVIRTGAEAR